MPDNYASMPALARETRHFVTAETTFGTLVKPAAAKAVKALSFKISSPAPNRIDVNEARSTRSLLERITGETPPVAFSSSHYIRPSGAAGTPPDLHELIKAVLGTYTNTGSTSDKYEPSDTYGQESLCVYEWTPAHARTGLGLMLDSMKISGKGAEPPMIEFAGVCKKSVVTGRSTLDGAFSAAVGTLDTPTNIKADAVVAIYEAADGTTVVDDNSAAGYKVNSATATTITLEGSPAGTADEDVVAPWAPAETFESGSSIIAGINGAVTIGGTSAPVTEYEIEVKHNRTPYDPEVGQSFVTGYSDGWRSVTGTLTLKLTADQVKWLYYRESFTQAAVVLTLGTGAGSTLTISLDQVEFGSVDEEKPEDGVGTIKLPFVALGSSGADEIDLTFT